MKKWGRGGTKIWSLDNWQSLRPITLWGSVKKSELINYKGWQGVQRASSPNNFPLWVTRRYCPRDMTCKRCFMARRGSFAQTLWAVHLLDGKNWVTFLARISSDCTLHVFANLYLLAYCLSISLAPITHFLLNLLTRSSCIAYYPQLALSRTLDLVHCTFSSARIRGLGKDSHCPIIRLASW